MEATNLADLYGTPLLDWIRIRARLDQGLSQAPETGGPNRHTCWLATINPDGSPHVTGVGALWVDDAFWFETGEGTRKARTVDETGVALTAEYSAPSAGPPPWFVYRLSPRTATALLTVEPGGATRWRF
jgi:hypothetical protein